MGEFPRGQRGQTVNLLRFVSMVRIRPPPPINPRAVTVLGFLLRKNPSDLSDSLGFFLVGFGCNPAPAVLYWTGISS